jgi:hypothetical protein
VELTRHPKEVIRPTPEGFSLYRGDREVFSVSWEDVREIVAFKRDLITADCVCLAFRTSDEDVYFEVNEEIDGFVLLTDEMMSHFPNIHHDWFGSVPQPPFATNWTRLHGEPPVV